MSNYNKYKKSELIERIKELENKEVATSKVTDYNAQIMMRNIKQWQDRAIVFRNTLSKVNEFMNESINSFDSIKFEDSLRKINNIVKSMIEEGDDALEDVNKQYKDVQLGYVISMDELNEWKRDMQHYEDSIAELLHSDKLPTNVVNKNEFHTAIDELKRNIHNLSNLNSHNSILCEEIRMINNKVNDLNMQLQRVQYTQNCNNSRRLF